MRCLPLLCLSLVASPVLAQERPDLLSFELTTGAVAQSRTDIEGGGSVSATAAVIDLSGSLLISERAGIGIGIELGRGRYEFQDVPAFGSDFDYRSDSISISYDFRLGETGFGFVAPTVRWDGEIDTDASKAMTYGVLAGAAWRVSPNLLIGPALGVFTTLDDDYQAFPFLLVEWDISDRLQLSTGQGVGATQGPGLVLSYALDDVWSLSLAGRVEDVEFRLDDDSAVADGIARDQSFPLVASIGWSPNDRVSLNAFAGMETGGRFTLSDEDGREIVRRDYDPAPILGAILSVSF